MKILIMNIELPPVGGGAGIQSWYLAQGLTNLNNEVKIITSHFRGFKYNENIEGIEIFRIPTIRKRIDFVSNSEILVYLISNTICSFNIVKNFKPDVLLSFFAIPCGLTSLFYNKLFKIPYVISLRGADVPFFEPKVYDKIYPFLIPLFKTVCSYAKFVIANSDSLKEEASKFYKGDIKVINNGINTKVFHPKDRNNKSRNINLLTVGRLVKRKDYKTMILGFKHAMEMSNRRTLKLEIVGDGPQRREIECLVGNLNLEEHVILHGNVLHDRLVESYHNADIYISTSMNEGMPNVLLEAMACGLPIISTNIPSINGLIINNVNGLLFECGNFKELGERINFLAENDDKRTIMGKESREISLKYDTKSFAREYFYLLSQC